MYSTIADLGAWAASMSGSSLLSDELAAQRLETGDFGSPPFEYGLGIIAFGPSYGHEGEAIGWESWAGRDPASGVTVVVFASGCRVGSEVLGTVGNLRSLLAERPAAD